MSDRYGNGSGAGSGTTGRRERRSRRGPSGGTADRVTEVCELLAERRRRHVCALLGRRAPRTLDDLASAVAAREAGSEGAVTAEHRERVKLSLYHVHLPRLAEAGVVAFDRDAGRVARGEAAAEVAATLAALGPAE